MKKETEIFVNFIDQMMQQNESVQLDLSVLSEDDRVLGEKLIQLQRIFTHMNKQAEQVVSGSFQQEEVPGGVPDAFTDMISEMKKRTSALENERNLFIQFTESARERIVVLDEETGDMLFGNKAARFFHEENVDHMESAHELNNMSKCSIQNPITQWEHEVKIPQEDGTYALEYYQVNSIYIMWENRGAIAHMFSDMTEMRKVRDIAMKDQMTDTYNRHYAMEYLNQLESDGKPYTIGFVDVDYLKYCNDECTGQPFL